MVFAFASLASLVGKNSWRTLMGALIGLILATMGIDANTGVARYIFGIPDLLAGIDFLVVVIGLSLGSGFEPASVGQSGDWALMLAGLCLSVTLTLFVIRWMLERFWAKDATSALLASAPGTMSMAVSIAADGRRDMTTVPVMQSVRLLVLATGLPLLFFATGTMPAVAFVRDCAACPNLPWQRAPESCCCRS